MLNQEQQTAVNCKTQKEFDDLRDAYKKYKSWSFVSEKWEYYKKIMCVRFERRKGYADLEFYKSEGWEVISFKEAIKKLKGKAPTEKPTDWQHTLEIKNSERDIKITKDQIHLGSHVLTIEESKEQLSKLRSALAQHKKHFTK